MGIRQGWHFDKDFGYTGSLSTKNMKRGGQTSNDRLDESLGARDGAERTKKQSYKDRRNESRGMTRRKSKVPMGDVVVVEETVETFKKGGSKNWIQGAVKKPGALTNYVKGEGVKMKDGKIPSGVLNKLASGKPATKGGSKPSETTQKRANLAKTFKGMKKARGGKVNPNIRDEEARVIGVQDDAADEMKRVRRRKPKDAQERRDKSQQLKRVSSRERNARDEMKRLRDESEYDIQRKKIGGRSKGYPTHKSSPMIKSKA